MPIRKNPGIAISIMLAAAVVLFARVPEAAAATVPTVTVGSRQIVLTHSQRSGDLFYYPDTTYGAVQVGDTYYLFASSYISSIGHTGIIGITTTDLDKLRSTYSRIKITQNLPLGGSGSFDQNYTGGGPVYFDSADGLLIMLYHGEYWYTGTGSPFYAGLGLAVSRDLGQTWTRLGEVLSPAVPRNDCGQGAHGPSFDIGVGDLLARPDGYLYAYFNDMNDPTCADSSMVTAVARAPIASVIASAQAGGQPPGTLFMKYCNGSFGCPGMNNPNDPAAGGGASSNVMSGFRAFTPSVSYDSAISEYVGVFPHDGREMKLTFSPDGINWSNPVTVLSGKRRSKGFDYFLGTLLNTSGGDPNNLGSSFYLYYDSPYGVWSKTNLYRVQITLSGTGVSGSGTAVPSIPSPH